MAQRSLFYRWFGFGKTPAKYLELLELEDVIYHEEGLAGHVTMKEIRAPGRRHSWKRNWFTGSIVITRKTFAIFNHFRSLVYVLIDHEKFTDLEIHLDGERLQVDFDAGDFMENWTGSVSVQIKIPYASKLNAVLEQAVSKNSGAVNG